MRCVVRAGSPSVHALGLAAAGLAVLLSAAVLPLDAPPLSLFPCPFRAATLLPCLSCGCTHAFAAAVRLHPIDALRSNPLGAFAAAAFAVHIVWTALRLCGLRWVPAPLPVTPRVRIGAAALLGLNWAFLVLRGGP